MGVNYLLYLNIAGIVALANVNITPTDLPSQYVDQMESADTILGCPGSAVRKFIRQSFGVQDLYQPDGVVGPVITKGEREFDVYIDDGHRGE